MQRPTERDIYPEYIFSLCTTFQVPREALGWRQKKNYGRQYTYELSGIGSGTLDLPYPIATDPVAEGNATYGKSLGVKLCDYAVAASVGIKNAIYKVYDWTGIWGTLTGAMGGGYLLTSGNNHTDWLNKLFATLGVIALGKTVDRIEKKYKAYKKEKEISGVKREYLGFMRELMTSELGIDEKIKFKYRNGVDNFTRKLGKGKGCKASELRIELDKMKNCLGRYIETRDGNHENDRKYVQKEGTDSGSGKVA